MGEANRETSFKDTGAVEQDRPEQETNVAPLSEQLDHSYQDPLNKSNDSGMPNQGQTPEFTGEKQGRNELDRDTNAKLPNAVESELQQSDPKSFNQAGSPEHGDTDQNAQNFDDRIRNEKRNSGEEVVAQDPGESQKRNQGGKKDDDLAA